MHNMGVNPVTCWYRYGEIVLGGSTQGQTHVLNMNKRKLSLHRQMETRTYSAGRREATVYSLVRREIIPSTL